MSLEVVVSKNVFQYLGSVGHGTLRSFRNDKPKVVSTEGISAEDSVHVVLVSVTEVMLGGDVMCAVLEVTSLVIS